MEHPSSSSKVTVEYFDPYGVYQLLSPGLLPRLPLRNLHWESHAGPLRSIASLHIDLIPSAQAKHPSSSTDLASASTLSLSRVKSEDSAASGDDGFRTQALGQAAVERPESIGGPSKTVVKERRHQIPGLRQTPYLKVLFVRCDDSETYKTQTRKEVREWIKEQTPPATKSSAQENHDAFEWLIVHVIVPNTAAATQPRTGGKSSEGSSGSSSDKAGTRWGKGSSTILEKLRADFNGSSRSAVDRIAQIRIGVNDVPYEMLPRVVPAIPGSYSETPQENENAWLDLVSKFKSLILSSFDMRVGQYEEDIREKDAQRSLPGWNFCTFFVLKEGLARGFESVGLVEDALVGYDELAVGLDAIVREQSATGSGAEHGGSFLPFTEDLKHKAESARTAMQKDMGSDDVVDTDDPIDLQSTNQSAESVANEIPLNATKKRYRELILSNDISIFDFRCYLFARQLSLLLRIANAWSSQEELLAKLKEQRESSLQGVAARLPATQPSEDVENLAVLGEVCRRAMDFVTSIGRVMRDDIWSSWRHSQQTLESEVDTTTPQDPAMMQVVDNIVASFTFAIAQQILAQTSTKSLPIPPSTLAPPSSKMGPDGQEQKAAIPEPKTMMHPARSTSLALRSRSREPPSPGLFPSGRRNSVPEQGATSPFLKAGLEELAAHRAELYILSRNVLEQVGKKHEWGVGWAEMAHLQDASGETMEEVDLDQPSTISNEGDITSKLAPSAQGIESKLLRTALDNQDDFYRLYETLTDKALRHYTVANHLQSVQSSMADLAVLKYHLTDFAAAASYFYRMTPFYGEGGWAEVELSMLVMYAKCLKELQRKEEYVRVVLKLLSRAAKMEKERLQRKSTFRIGDSQRFPDEEIVSTSSYLPELMQITKNLQHEVHVPLQNFFGKVEVDGTVQYLPGTDGFGLQIRLQYLLIDDLSVEKARVKITPLGGDTNRDLWLEATSPLVFKHGKVQISVQSNVLVPGTYYVSHIILHTSNIVLQYPQSGTASIPKKDDEFFKCPKLLIYQRSGAFDVRLFASKSMHLDRNRFLELELASGWNNVSSGELHLRAATAGLRLQTSDIKVISGPLEVAQRSEAGVIKFGLMESGSIVRIGIPYNLEHEVNDISIKLEISYTTERGTFFSATAPTISIMLPLGVNVQDVFKHKALFSKFTISSATSSPLRLLGSTLEQSEVFDAHGGLALSKPVIVFPRQPASMSYKITKLTAVPKPHPKQKPKSSLSLVLHYICLEEEVEDAVTGSLRKFPVEESLRPYMRLVLPAVISELRVRISPYDYERAAILNEISTSIFSSVRWRDHFLGLGRTGQHNEEVASILSRLLESWQQETRRIPLMPIAINDETIARSRSITIPVDVPSVTVVHTADLKLLEVSTGRGNNVVAAVNQPITGSLSIKWTRIWDTEQLDHSATENDFLEFFYEVSGAPDTWLIGGRRKGHFRIPKDPEQQKEQKLSFPVVLIPLREGFLPFPNVEIKPAPFVKVHKPGHAGSDDDTRVKQTSITCETDFKNAGETIRAISDSRRTTVSLDASGPQGGAWLLESERREAVNGGIVLG
ncbi:TMEM1 family protein-like protein [Stipitochalara longipes BDJ]|nr:TMEM1 family protein-like protein [Stipitochalara longipes BDJ]